MEALNAALAGLKVRQEGDAVGNLKKIIHVVENEESEEDLEEYAKKLVKDGILEELKYVLSSNSEGQELAAQVVAEIAKVETNRPVCVERGLVPDLLNLLPSKDVDLCIQSCRGLGNICFDNDIGRDEVDKNNGVQKLLELLKTHANTKSEDAARLRMTACGFLLNLTNTHGMSLPSGSVHESISLQKVQDPDDADSIRLITLGLNLNPNSNHETIQEQAIIQGAMEILDNYLKDHVSDERVCQMALLCVGSLADSDIGREKLNDCEISQTIAALLDTATGKDLSETILELLANLAESDEVKTQLAKTNLISTLISFIKECDGKMDEDSLMTQKLSSDLTILLLTGDPSMDILYDSGKGVVYKESLEWLKSNSQHLQMSGALAIGNFARNDEHCMQLVKNGITSVLLDIIKQKPDTNVHPTVQHAIFSALRNLAIPAANKSIMLDEGVLDAVLPYCKCEMMAVQFKLLGVLRMIIDGQERAAKLLGTNPDFMEKVIEWCQVEDHAGVKGEANRLNAWLVKHSRCSDVMKLVIKSGGIPYLIAMANSEHAVMQNEALVALTLIACTILDDAESEFIDAQLVPALKVILTEDTTLTEILCNVLTLTKEISKSEKLLQQMQVAEFGALVKGFAERTDDDNMLQNLAKNIASVFE